MMNCRRLVFGGLVTLCAFMLMGSPADAQEGTLKKIKETGVLTLGHRGRPALQAPFNHPADVAVSPAGEIYVADGYGNASVHRFSADGRHLGSWGAPGSGSGASS